MKTGKTINIKKLLEGITLEGFTRDNGQGWIENHERISTHQWNGQPLPCFARFVSADVVIILDYSKAEVDTGDYTFYSGHTFLSTKVIGSPTTAAASATRFLSVASIRKKPIERPAFQLIGCQLLRTCSESSRIRPPKRWQILPA